MNIAEEFAREIGREICVIAESDENDSRLVRAADDPDDPAGAVGALVADLAAALRRVA